ncbi:type II secretion system F family protein [Aureimonas sp. AU12]|uniref:type II secretion system F family protein n=1 Tax=Aureimonas sp. AU12 TaxID=1638161 RepID=UPI000782B742|nr:type II secretion system F family protein [Aureimonas sp. AU12]
MIVVGFVLLITLATLALVYGILEPRLQLEKNTKSRISQYKSAETDRATRQHARDRVNEVSKRRKTLQNSLKDLEEKTQARDRHTKKLSLERRIAQAGLKTSMRSFVLVCFGVGAAAFLASLVFQLSLVIALGIGVVAGFGLPRWVLGYLRKRRQASFTLEFANAIDVITRGIRSGLPLNDTLRMIAADTPEPVRSEFARIVEAQQMGMPIAEAVERLYQNMPLPETNFFAIVVSIQSQAGGNLAEALSNLSSVLRERRRMKGKIKAMSMEAKASGYIIGSLPIIVGFLVYLTSPDYISVLFTTSTGHIVLAASAFWMGLGIMVMRNMINFDF